MFDLQSYSPTFQKVTFLLYIALGYLVITSVILWLNYRDFSPLYSAEQKYFNDQAPKASICIPARNEANTIELCVQSALNQKYPSFDVYVLDDQSTDGTTQKLRALQSKYPEQLTIISGQPKPADWLGKSWACHQLAEASTGEIIVFIDADTRLAPNTLARTIRTMGRDVVDFVTLWPDQKLGTFWEKTVIPLVYFGLLTLLPNRYVYNIPKWIPSALRKKMAPLFAAACGQFMAFKRHSYRAIGGHESVKNDIIEDVALAKNIKKNGFAMNMYNGADSISCRMYQSSRELWQGFRKNFFAGFGCNIPLFTAMALLHLIVFIIPLVTLPFILIWGSPQVLVLCLIAIFGMLLQRLVVDLWFGWEKRYTLLHSLGVGWFQALGVQVLLDYVNKQPAKWKDREV
ncbi:chlorobactene glucosyltransferase [Fodinibius salinus]|uniref:Chlorobactene glucosyltransferase n=1 Tax=Fodinibius salinus TaxID=860790 RepID=A0A5D3YMU1_9BACT|nr:glycosyltransferase family 2 protein [Fodinibius salinus]TYP95495.1 chlorobactene glucosyltransferase [Fodinibius salinus]